MKKFIGHRVTRNASALGVVQIVGYVAPFLVLMHLTKVLGVATYGVVAFSIGIVQIAAVVLDLGFVLSATQKISVERDRPELIARLSGAVFCIKLAAFLICACAITAYAMTSEKYAAHSMLFVLSLLPLLGHCLQPIWLFSGIERMGYLTMFMVVTKLSFVALVFLLVSSEGDYLWIPVADGIAQLSGAAIAIGLIYKAGHRIALPARSDIAGALRMTGGFFLSRLAATAYSGTGVLILGLLAAPAVVGVYALAEQLYRAIQSLFGPVVQALYPYMARERDLALLRKVAFGFAVVAMSGAIVGYFVSPWLIARLFGASWELTVPVMNVFLVAIAVHTMTILAGYPLAAALQRLDVANRSVFYGSLLYAVLVVAIVVSGRATPVAFAWLVVIVEGYVLAHRTIALFPSARRLYSAQKASASAAAAA